MRQRWLLLLVYLFQWNPAWTAVLTNTAGRPVVTPTPPAQVVGHFTLSFTDLSVPLAGLPIQVIRTYDSRDQRPGDFGIGWTLDIKNARAGLRPQRSVAFTPQRRYPAQPVPIHRPFSPFDLHLHAQSWSGLDHFDFRVAVMNLLFKPAAGILLAVS